MSARKIETTDSFQQSVTVESREARLSLTPGSVIVRRNGIEFRSPSSFSLWTEMTVTLQSPGEPGKVNCSGVVVSCTGNKHSGYHISMLFTNLTKQAQSRLSTLVYSTLD